VSSLETGVSNESGVSRLGQRPIDRAYGAAYPVRITGNAEAIAGVLSNLIGKARGAGSRDSQTVRLLTS